MIPEPGLCRHGQYSVCDGQTMPERGSASWRQQTSVGILTSWTSLMLWRTQLGLGTLSPCVIQSYTPWPMDPAAVGQGGGPKMEIQWTILQEHVQERPTEQVSPWAQTNQPIPSISLPDETTKNQQKTQRTVPVQQCRTLHLQRTLLWCKCVTSLKETRSVCSMTNALPLGDTRLPRIVYRLRFHGQMW